jgi:hypothetical protein
MKAWFPMFRFTIRDVLWLTVVVAVALWSVKERSAIQQRTANLESERAALQKERDLLRTSLDEIRDNVFERGYRRGVENQRHKGRQNGGLTQVHSDD